MNSNDPISWFSSAHFSKRFVNLFKVLPTYTQSRKFKQTRNANQTIFSWENTVS